VTRGDSRMRRTVISNSKELSHFSTAPLIGAALEGSGEQASGRWPSPARSPEVGSSPIQPAPGRYTSHQACRSVKSCAAPAGPSVGLHVGAQLDQVPRHEAGGEADVPEAWTRSQAESRQEPLPSVSVSSGDCTPCSSRMM
jgi:hypothetical protein